MQVGAIERAERTVNMLPLRCAWLPAPLRIENKPSEPAGDRTDAREAPGAVGLGKASAAHHPQLTKYVVDDGSSTITR